MKRMDIDGSQAVAADALSRTLLRGVIGVIMTAHGWQKLTGFADWHAQVVQLGVPAPDVSAWLSVAAEFLGGLALLFGLLTRLAGFAVLFNMVVAIATVHIGNGLFAQNGGFEYPLLLAATALYFLATGAGPISVDAVLRRRRQQRKTMQREYTQQPAPHPAVPEEALYDKTGRRIEHPGHPGGRSPRH